ncbi:MAG: GIY-YIG nuclease family protein [Candidatus Acidiferrales bacterium]
MAEGLAGPWFCYIVKCSDGALYTGISNNVAVRVEEHNRGFGPRFTKARRPVELIWSQDFPDIFVARRREIEVKGWSRAKKLRLANERTGVRRVSPSNPPLAGSQGEGE